MAPDQFSDPNLPQVRIINCFFNPLDLKGTVDAVFNALSSGKRGWLSTVNVAILMMMRSDPKLQNYVDRSIIVVADGQPIVWLSKWLCQPLPARVAGVDLIDEICNRAANEGKSVYFLGASQSVVDALAERQRTQFPMLKIYYSDGYFEASQAAERAECIRASGADILFVGMGAPRQELFIEEQWEQLGVGIAVGVGGSFDVLSGLRARAPNWMQRVGLEWLFRLIQEPRRLFMRYLITNSQFTLLALHAVLTKRWGR